MIIIGTYFKTLLKCHKILHKFKFYVDLVASWTL